MNRIIFSVPKESDFCDVWTYCSNRNVTKYLTWDKYDNQSDFEVFFKKKYLKYFQFPNLFRTISMNSRFMGTLHMLTRENGTLQIGFGLLPEFWEKGTGKMVLNDVCQMIIKEYPAIRTIRADVNVKNIAMIKMLESYGFQNVAKLSENRISYKYQTDVYRFKKKLFSNTRIEAVFEVGNLNKGELSDYDYIISFYEEVDIKRFISDLKGYHMYIMDNPAPYHYFLKSEYGEIFDIYLVASSFVHAIFNVTKNIFDKSDFLSSKVRKSSGLDYQVNYEEMYVFYLIKILDKFSSGKLVQTSRNFISLRDKVIVPMAKKYGYASVANITDICWGKDSLLYDAYNATFVELDNEKMRHSIQIIYDVSITLFSDNLDLSSQFERIKKNVEWL